MTDDLGRFLEFFRSSDFRFYQERDLGLDLYASGLAGVLLFALAVTATVVFLLAIFQVVPVRRHVVTLLLGVGGMALAVGFVRSFMNFSRLDLFTTELLQPQAGPAPASDRQLAALAVLPLVVGLLTFAAAVLGCLYMGVFWGGSLLRRKDGAD